MKIAILTIFLTVPLLIYGQPKTHRKCGPGIYLNTRYTVQNDSLNRVPYNAIVHINMKGWGTATFINDSTLITARHIADKKRLKGISIHKNIYEGGTVKDVSAELTARDFRVSNLPYDNCHFISSDISFVIFTPTGKEKIKTLYTNHLEVADVNRLSLDSSKVVTLSGYPIDLAENGQNNTDILASKSTHYGELLFDQNCKMVGYKLFTCSGDSGAPLWVFMNGKYYIIAIHHGGPEPGTIFNKEKRNSAALIRDNILIYTR